MLLRLLRFFWPQIGNICERIWASFTVISEDLIRLIPVDILQWH